MSTRVPATQSHRRRWSHVFPDGEDEFQLAEAGGAGPNWRLYTGCVARRDRRLAGRFPGPTPSRRRTIIVFTVSTDEAAAETVAQMVALIAGDYQLVEDFKKGHHL